MSKFFRGPDSSGSESSEDEETEEVLNQSISQLAISENGQALSDGSLESIVDRTSTTANTGQNWLLHSLLEERCLNQIRAERQKHNSRYDERDIQREASRRYHLLVARLAPLNLVSVGLDDDRHSATRQSVRNRLDSVQFEPETALKHYQESTGAVPGPLRRLLTEGDAQSVTSNDWQIARVAARTGGKLSSFDSVLPPHALMPSRYSKDFDELGVLGKGGYGEVFHVKHKLDGRTYAVKKVPIRQSMMNRVTIEGEPALDDILTEVRSLSRLDHPNVVRYFSSWIEWTTRQSFAASWSETAGQGYSKDAVLDAAQANSFGSQSLDRVKTQSDTNEQDIGFTFESSTSASAENMPIADIRSDLGDIIFSHSSTDGAQLFDSRPSLALHMQMDIYPMTLADFLTPKTTDSDIKPLAHCFHLEPTIHILLAILDGVEYLHTERIVHRDLKPANIFLRPEHNSRASRGCVDLFLCSACRAEKKADPVALNVRIGDFGLVTNIAKSDSADLSSSPPKAVGTETYRPTTNDSDISPRLDIFALGIIACELLCKFGTQMERRHTLQDVRRGIFPKRFASCAGHHANDLTACVASMLSGDRDITISNLKQRLFSMVTKSNEYEPTIRRSST